MKKTVVEQEIFDKTVQGYLDQLKVHNKMQTLHDIIEVNRITEEMAEYLENYMREE